VTDDGNGLINAQFNLEGKKMDERFDAVLSLLDGGILSQYWNTVRRRESSEPERELMLAVLKDAIMTYKKNLCRDTPLARDTERWFSERDDDGLFSFEMVCAILGLSAERIRAELVSWKSKRLARIEAHDCGDRIKPAVRYPGGSRPHIR
jgi:hypothetical protein